MFKDEVTSFFYSVLLSFEGLKQKFTVGAGFLFHCNLYTFQSHQILHLPLCNR